MEMAFLQIFIKVIFPKDFQNPSNGFDMTLPWIFGIDKNIIQINNEKDIELLSQDFIDIALEASWHVGQTKRHYLILKMTVSSLKSRLLFVTFFDPHLVMGTNQIQLCKSFDTAYTIERFTDEQKWIPVLDGDIIEVSIIDIKPKTSIELLVEQDWGTSKGF